MRRRTFIALLGTTTTTTGCLRLQGGESTATSTGSGKDTQTGPPATGTAATTDSGSGDANPTEDVETAAPPGSLSLTPTWDVPGGHASKLWSDDGYFYTATGQSLQKLAPDGTTVWQTSGFGDSGFLNGIGFGDSAVAVGVDPRQETSPARLVVFDDEGAERLSHDAPADGKHYRTGAVAVSGDTVIFATQADGSGDEQRPRIAALDVGTGAVRWTVDVEEGFVADIDVWRDRALVTMTDQVLDLDLESGAENAAHDVFFGFGGVTIAADTLYGGHNPVQGRSLPGFDRTWERQVLADVEAEPVVTAGSLVVATEAGHVISLDRATGDRRWRARANGEIDHVEVDGGYLWVKDRSGFVYAFNLTDGSTALTDEPDELGDHRPFAVVDDTVVIRGQAYTVEKE
ncbi:outer membrane protein assembly factor BamB family protein [Haloarchaeobius sp. DT45]|uniref:outer membrane protein assembly factor BamB family protein n=1 Tax=Haloarchaeobius sp. DT45 TaxID=3446116 RepID=UPI003F6D3708